jgi:hypothetical protein
MGPSFRKLRFPVTNFKECVRNLLLIAALVVVIRLLTDSAVVLAAAQQEVNVVAQIVVHLGFRVPFPRMKLLRSIRAPDRS